MKKSIRDAVLIESLEVAGLGTVTAGLAVLHPVFGPGSVISILEFPLYVRQRHAIGVQFDSVGSKLLDPEYAKLRLR